MRGLGICVVLRSIWRIRKQKIENFPMAISKSTATTEEACLEMNRRAPFNNLIRVIIR